MTSTHVPRRLLAASVLSFLVSCGGGGGGGGGGGTPTLPPGFASLAAGFTADVVAGNLASPVKMAFTPDGRLFYNELTNGNTRIIDAGGTLLPTPFSTMSILTFAEQGLLGLAIDPNFGTTGYVYVYATVPAGGGHGARNQIVRWTAVGNVGTSPTVILDDLPYGSNHNAGDLKFGPDGKLYATIGDTGDSSLAQSDVSTAGRVLRMNSDGSVPADNPIASSREWARGLRTCAWTAHSPSPRAPSVSARHSTTKRCRSRFASRGALTRPVARGPGSLHRWRRTTSSGRCTRRRSTSTASLIASPR